jgi:MGT family glycosyltransferase
MRVATCSEAEGSIVLLLLVPYFSWWRLRCYKDSEVRFRIQPLLMPASTSQHQPMSDWLLRTLLILVIAASGADADQSSVLQEYKDTTGKHIMFVSLAVPSHIRPLNHMASELMDRGYRISFAIPEEGRKMVNTGIEIVSSGPSAVPPKELKQRFRVMSQEITPFKGILASFNEILLPSVVPMFKSLRPTIEANQTRPDIMVIDICALAGLMLAQEYDVPFLLNNPSLLFSPGESSALTPAWGSGYGTSMTLSERCINALFPRILAMALIPPFMHLNKIRWELGLDLYRSQHELLSNSVILTDTVFGIEYPRALPPMIKMVGPLVPAKRPSLPTAVTDWIRKGEPKVVLIHLGSMTYLEPWQVKEMLDGFSSDAFRVLWVMNKSQRQAVPYVPDSFLIEANVPYLAIVSHPAVIAVVSHCQLDAAQEALFFGKPILCLPFYIDQPDVASRIVDIGAGLSLDKSSLSSGVLSHRIWTLISNASFSQRATAISKLLRRAGGTAYAATLVQEVLTLGVDHWLLPESNYPWHHRALLDVGAVYVAILLLIFIPVRAVFRACACLTLANTFYHRAK